MKTAFAVAAMAGAALFAPASASAAPATFVTLEDRLSQALAAYDAEAVGKLWDDAFVFVNPAGRMSHKAQRLVGIARPAAGAVALTSHNDSVDVQYEDKAMAVVVVRSTWRQGDQVLGAPYLATHVWVRRGDGWKLLSAQVAEIAP